MAADRQSSADLTKITFRMENIYCSFGKKLVIWEMSACAAWYHCVLVYLEVMNDGIVESVFSTIQCPEEFLCIVERGCLGGGTWKSKHAVSDG